jgi:DinB family protein
MRTSSSLVAIATLCLTTTAAAQGAPLADAFREMTGRQAKNLVAAAEEMPAAKYGYKPTPAQMSFGAVIAHLSGGNDFFCSKLSGTEAPKRKDLAKDAGKDALVGRLKETFEFCDTALGKLDDSKLGESLPWFGERKISRGGMMLATAEDWGDHYSQLANYLRLNGLLPPTAKKKQA